MHTCIYYRLPSIDFESITRWSHKRFRWCTQAFYAYISRAICGMCMRAWPQLRTYTGTYTNPRMEEVLAWRQKVDATTAYESHANGRIAHRRIYLNSAAATVQIYTGMDGSGYWSWKSYTMACIGLVRDMMASHTLIRLRERSAWYPYILHTMNQSII